MKTLVEREKKKYFLTDFFGEYKEHCGRIKEIYDEGKANDTNFIENEEKESGE